MQCLRRGVLEVAGGRGAARSLSSSSSGGEVSAGEEAKRKPKTGVLMLNMGGPRNSGEVHEFLGNLFADRDIIKLPVQNKLGPWIAKRRTPNIIEKYNEIGGGSPIFGWTDKQGELLCRRLDELNPESAPHKHYVGFRYARPLTETALEEIEKDGVEHVVAMSQYPQYSCTTSGSSMKAIYKYYQENYPLSVPGPRGTENRTWSVIDRWPTHPLLIKTFAENIKKELATFPEEKRGKVVLLFSAHSVPQYVMDRGDPYPAEVGATVSLVMNELGWSNPYRLTWQSKVGPLPWLKPGTEEAIKAFVKRGQKNLMLVPIAFVNDHIETLHELDIEYAEELGAEVGAERIARCPAPNTDPIFIDCLADLVSNHLKQGQTVNPQMLMTCPMCTDPSCRTSKMWWAKATGFLDEKQKAVFA